MGRRRSAPCGRRARAVRVCVVGSALLPWLNLSSIVLCGHDKLPIDRRARGGPRRQTHLRVRTVPSAGAKRPRPSFDVLHDVADPTAIAASVAPRRSHRGAWRSSSRRSRQRRLASEPVRPLSHRPLARSLHPGHRADGGEDTALDETAALTASSMRPDSSRENRIPMSNVIDARRPHYNLVKLAVFSVFVGAWTDGRVAARRAPPKQREFLLHLVGSTGGRIRTATPGRSRLPSRAIATRTYAFAEAVSARRLGRRRITRSIPILSRLVPRAVQVWFEKFMAVSRRAAARGDALSRHRAKVARARPRLQMPVAPSSWALAAPAGGSTPKHPSVGGHADSAFTGSLVKHDLFETQPRSPNARRGGAV